MGTSAWPANSVRSLSSMRINMKLLLLLVAVLLVAVLLVAASVAASLSVWRSTLLMPSTQIRRGILMHLLRRIGV